jgi:hypothetical protein
MSMSTRLRIRYGAAGEQEHEEGEEQRKNGIVNREGLSVEF